MCKTTNDNQECLATGIFEGDKSQHTILSNELSVLSYNQHIYYQ